MACITSNTVVKDTLKLKFTDPAPFNATCPHCCYQPAAKYITFIAVPPNCQPLFKAPEFE